MARPFIVIISFLFLLTSFGQSSEPSLQLKVREALKKMFGDSVAIATKSFILTEHDKEAIFQHSKSRWANDTVVVYLCRGGKRNVGFGFVDNVKGKVQFITYLVGVQADGTVQDVDVLAYRESYGGEVAYESFRKQFRGKTSHDALQPGGDIKNISGATISVRAITNGTKRILATFDLLKSRLAQ